jgi:hypothetical protein
MTLNYSYIQIRVPFYSLFVVRVSNCKTLSIVCLLINLFTLSFSLKSEEPYYGHVGYDTV